MPGAWNMLGYSERKLGNYDAALVAYGRALSLRPNYVEAIEYRGEAYLGLNRVADAKRTYLDLFTMNRELSDTFLEAMKQWIAARTTAPGGVDAATIRDLDQWVHERTRIAAKTSALTREGAAASWR
jgi:tetratricopeptide (TPR) repeat protein